MTVDDRSFVDLIIANNGRVPRDSGRLSPSVPFVRIVQYTNAWGGTAYGCEFEGELGKYRETAFVQNPIVLWERKP